MEARARRRPRSTPSVIRSPSSSFACRSRRPFTSDPVRRAEVDDPVRRLLLAQLRMAPRDVRVGELDVAVLRAPEHDDALVDRGGARRRSSARAISRSTGAGPAFSGRARRRSSAGRPSSRSPASARAASVERRRRGRAAPCASRSRTRRARGRRRSGARRRAATASRSPRGARARRGTPAARA